MQGFRIKWELRRYGCKLAMPAHRKKGQKKDNPQEKMLTQVVANLRIDVEIVIGRIHSMGILSRRMPGARNFRIDTHSSTAAQIAEISTKVMPISQKSVLMPGAWIPSDRRT